MTETTLLKVDIETEVKIPTLPNYLITEKGSISVWKLSDKQLRQIGLKWIDALVEKARNRRKVFGKIT